MIEYNFVACACKFIKEGDYPRFFLRKAKMFRNFFKFIFKYAAVWLLLKVISIRLTAINFVCSMTAKKVVVVYKINAL